MEDDKISLKKHEAAQLTSYVVNLELAVKNNERKKWLRERGIRNRLKK